MKNYTDSKIKKIVHSFNDWFLDDSTLSKGRMTQNLYPYKNLFEPIHINKLKIKNRIIMGPMGNIGMADESGKPSQKMIQYFTERAKGGVGLITSGMIPVDWRIDPSFEDLHKTGIFPRIDSHRSTYSGWRELVESCHAFGSKFFIQLSPGMGRVGNPECLIKKHKLPVSASVNPNWYLPAIPCKRISDLSLKKLIKKTGQVALDCKSLGMDGVYLHGHSGYLIEQMTDTAYNHRKLGRYSNYMNFGVDLVKEIRKRCGDSFPIHYRIDLSSALNETYGDLMNTNKILKHFKNTRTVEKTFELIKALISAGVDAFDVDLGAYENWWMPHPPNGMPPALHLPTATMLKNYISENNLKSNAGFDIPVIAVGKLGFPDLAESALREEKCDMIMLSRPLLADPYWPKKVYAGEVSSIRPCIGDHEGCLAQIAIGGHPHCAVNPRTAFEHKFKDLTPAKNPKEIAVIGAGPAGVMLAVTCATRGHKVTLFDKNSKAGGMLLLGSVPKIKYELQNYVDYLNTVIDDSCKKHSLKVEYNTTVTPEYLKDKNFSCIVTCTGSQVIAPKIKKSSSSAVISGIDFLKNPLITECTKNIVVLGGSDVGCEIAHMLSYEQNKNVTIVEKMPYFMKKTCTSNRNHMLYSLKSNNVNLWNCSELAEVRDGKAVIKRNCSPTVPDPCITWSPILPENISNPFEKKIREDIQTKQIDCDLTILCIGSKPNDSLYYECMKNNIAPEIHNIGDSNSPGRVLEAVKSAFHLGQNI